MATFLNLSKISINVDTIRYVIPGVSIKDGVEKPVCVVCFIDSSPPHSFYGQDADALCTFINEHAPHRIQENRILN